MGNSSGVCWLRCWLPALLLPLVGAAVLAAEVTPAKGGGVLSPAGQPEDFKDGKQSAYALWFADGAWHVRATARTGQRGTFAGVITLEKGKILSGDYQGLEIATKAKKGKSKKAKNTDLLWLSDDHRTLKFELNSIGSTDGFSFKVGPTATEIEFKLLFNGSEAPDRVLVGKLGQHPEKIPFVLKAHP